MLKLINILIISVLTLFCFACSDDKGGADPDQADSSMMSDSSSDAAPAATSDNTSDASQNDAANQDGAANSSN